MWSALGILGIEAAIRVARLLLNERSLPLAATKETNQKVHGIVHTAATAAAAVGAKGGAR